VEDLLPRPRAFGHFNGADKITELSEMTGETQERTHPACGSRASMLALSEKGPARIPV